MHLRYENIPVGGNARYLLSRPRASGFFACCEALAACDDDKGVWLIHEPNPEARRHFLSRCPLADLYSWMGDVHERMTGEQAFWLSEDSDLDDAYLRDLPRDLLRA